MRYPALESSVDPKSELPGKHAIACYFDPSRTSRITNLFQINQLRRHHLDENRWNEKAGLQRDALSSKLSARLKRGRRRDGR
jgi:hypothetical protein